MRWLKLLLSGLFTFVAVAAGLVFTVAVVLVALVMSAAKRLAGAPPPQPAQPRWPRTAPRRLKRVEASEVTVTDVPSPAPAIAAPLEQPR